MSALEKLKSRLAKILALARDPAATEGEKEAAMEQANKLMTEHQISEADLRDLGKEQEVGWVSIEILKRNRPGAVDWAMQVAASIPMILPVAVLMRDRRFVMFVGTETDRELAKFLFESLRNQLFTELRFYLKHFKLDGRTRTGLKFKDSFLLGAANVLAYRMNVLKKQRDTELARHEQALLVVSDKALEARKYADSMIPAGKEPLIAGDAAWDQAAALGESVGKRIQITQGVGDGRKSN
jgi:hypothetical protein